MVMHLLNQHCVVTGEKDLALHMTYDRLKPALDWVQLSYVFSICFFTYSTKNIKNLIMAIIVAPNTIDPK